MNSEAVRSRYDAARELARDAGTRTLQFFHQARSSFDIGRKGDGSLVTDADRDAETWLRAEIARRFPGDAILGEEFGAEAPHDNNGFRWILDPIDGTRSFVHGVPLYGTLVAIEWNDEPLIGVIEMPALNEAVHACLPGFGHEQSAMHESPQPDGSRAARPARVSSTTSLDGAIVCLTDVQALADATTPDGARLQRLANATHAMRGWSDCYAHLLCATGRCDIVAEPIMHPWDAAAMIPIMEAAGGRATDWRGVRSAHTGSTVSSNGHLHDAALRLLA